MFKEMSSFEIRDKLKEGWIKVWFAFDVLAAKPDISKKALEDHIDKLTSLNQIIAYKKDIAEPIKVENPPKGTSEAYSTAGEVEALVKSVFDLINIVIVYGPSSTEIIEPDEVKISIGDLQNSVNVISGVMHQFAQAGIGGFVIRT